MEISINKISLKLRSIFKKYLDKLKKLKIEKIFMIHVSHIGFLYRTHKYQYITSIKWKNA